MVASTVPPTSATPSPLFCWRWRRTSTAAAFFTASAIFLLNIIPQGASRHGGGDYYGWPKEFARGYTAGRSAFSLFTAPVVEFDVQHLAFDAVVAITAAFGVGLVLELRSRRTSRKVWQFTLNELLVAGMVTAAALGWTVHRNIRQEAALKRLHCHFDTDSYVPHTLRRYLPNMPGGWLRPFDRVTYLHVIGGERTDDFFEPLSQFPDCRELEIEAVFGDGALKHVAHLPALRYLKLESPRLRGEEFERLVTLPRLRTLRLCSPQLSQEGIRQLARLTNVEIDLELRGDGVTAATLAELEQVPGLWWLRLTEARLDDACVAALARLRQLSRLILDSIDVGEDSLLSIMPLGNQTSLQMHNVQSVSFEALNRLRQKMVGGSVVAN